MLIDEIIELDKALEPGKAEEIAGFLATNSIIEIKSLATFLDFSNQKRIRSLLDALLEQGIVQGEFVNKNKLRVDSLLEIPPNLELSAIPPDSLPLLGALIGFEEFKVSTFAELFRLRKKAIKQEICRLVAQGFISGEFKDKDRFQLKHAPSPDPIPIYQQKIPVRILIGACIVHKQVEFSTLTKILGETDELEFLNDLLTQFAHQTLKGYLKVKRNQVQIFFEDGGYQKVPLELSKLMGKFRIAAGALIAYQNGSIQELASKTGMSESELQQTIYTLAADGTLDPIITKGEIQLNTPPTITYDVDFDQLTDRERTILGMALSIKKCSLRSIARRLAVETIIVRKIFFDLILKGILPGGLTKGSNEEFHRSDSPLSLTPRPLHGIDHVIFGALVSNTKPNIRTLASQLGMSTTEFERALYLLLAKRVVDGELQGRNFQLNEVLIDMSSIPTSEVEPTAGITTLGYLLARPDVRFRDMAKDLGWDQEKVAHNIYSLIGIGKIRGQVDGTHFQLQDAPQLTPGQTPTELGLPYVNLFALLQAQSEEIFLIKELAKSLRISQQNVREQLSRLIGEGLLQGVLESKQFTRMTSTPSLRKLEDERICAYCGSPATESGCPQCEIDTSRCAVCLKSLDPNETDLLSCPHCKVVAHPAHLQEWVKTRGTCPHCKTRLTMETLEPVVSDDFDLDDEMLEVA